MNLYVMFDNIVAHISPSQSFKIIDCCICDVFEGFNCKKSLVTAVIKCLSVRALNCGGVQRAYLTKTL